VADFGTGRLNLTANFGYNSRGDLTSIQDARGYTSTATFDVLRRVTQTTAPSPFSYTTKFTYDDNGNKIKVERQTNDIANPWQTSQATFSADGKILTAVDPSSHTTTFEYDNLQRPWKTTDPLSRVMTRSYDDANRISTITDPTSTVAATYIYTDNGLVASIKDARNYTTSFTFDGFDRAKRTTYPDSTYEEVTSYNANGMPLTTRTRSAATVTFTYDELDRVKTRAPSGQATVTTVRDIAGRIVNISTPVVSGDPSSGTFQYFYDTAGRAYKETYPDSKSIIHELDANGNITKTTYPDGTYYVQRLYDELNRLTDIKLNGATTSAVQFQYDALSRRKRLIYENGTSTDYGFELDNDLNSLVQTFVGSSVSFTFGFDNVGQMTSQQVSDGANFLWHPGSGGTVSYGTANNLNQYPTVGGVSQTYSTDGCLTNDGTYKFEYNTERMLTRVRNASTNAVIADYRYDPMLRQRQKAVGATKTNFYYSGWQRLADYDGTAGTLQNRYVYGTSLDEILIQVASSGTKTYYHANNQRSVIAITNSSGTIINRYKYGPFGESAALTGTTHGYTGQRYDAETGLYYYKMRYYAPQSGRFLQPDPVGGQHLYHYCFNEPNDHNDPMGLWTNRVSIYINYQGLTIAGVTFEHTKLIIDYQTNIPGQKDLMYVVEGLFSIPKGIFDTKSNLIVNQGYIENPAAMYMELSKGESVLLQSEEFDVDGRGNTVHTSGDNNVLNTANQIEAQGKFLQAYLNANPTPYRIWDQTSNSVIGYILDKAKLHVPIFGLHLTPGINDIDFIKNPKPRLTSSPFYLPFTSDDRDLSMTLRQFSTSN
jgi:RHS repeat-associated protein